MLNSFRKSLQRGLDIPFEIRDREARESSSQDEP